MVEQIMALDQKVFLFCHQTLSNRFFDRFFVGITQLKYWYLPLGFLAVVLFVFCSKKGRQVFLLLVLTVALSDISCHVIKNTVQRPRPFMTIQSVHPLVDANGYSFPSGHATNIFAACVFLALCYRRWWKLLLWSAALVAFSRVYVGVHYPLDVLAGALLGSFIAFLIFRLFFGKQQKKEAS